MPRSRYDGDPRVHKLSDDEYLVVPNNGSGYMWRVFRDGGRWYAGVKDDPDVLDEVFDTADEMIAYMLRHWEER